MTLSVLPPSTTAFPFWSGIGAAAGGAAAAAAAAALSRLMSALLFEIRLRILSRMWTVEEVDFSTDLADPRARMTPAERHLVNRLVAFFATGDSIVGNNADQRLSQLGLPARYQVKNPFPFMELQDVQELANFFERRVSAYQVGVSGQVVFDETF
jgi:ribonucleotide reductase beta subunit family protein with ferritin-like domain